MEELKYGQLSDSEIQPKNTVTVTLFLLGAPPPFDCRQSLQTSLDNSQTAKCEKGNTL